MKLFFCMTRKSRQKLKYLENEKIFQDEIKSIFRHFLRAFIEAKKAIFFWKVRVWRLVQGCWLGVASERGIEVSVQKGRKTLED